MCRKVRSKRAYSHRSIYRKFCWVRTLFAVSAQPTVSIHVPDTLMLGAAAVAIPHPIAHCLLHLSTI